MKAFVSLLSVVALVMALSACGVGENAKPAKALPLEINGTLADTDTPPNSSAAISAHVDGNTEEPLLAQGTLDGTNITITLTDPDDVDSANLFDIKAIFENICDVSTEPANTKFAAVQNFNVGTGYLKLTDSQDPGGSGSVGDTTYMYWLSDQVATVQGTCDGHQVQLDLVRGWNLVAVTTEGDGNAELSVKSVSNPTSAAQWRLVSTVQEAVVHTGN
mgnify:CR=1 FL=1